ncbi:60S ribosomal protein L26 [Microtus ochrogaster]|uniref:60S ribosomal protein L26 n=1 Tax=Microtus ochrogaster TaxID=79684 RepID=A0A8J6KT35_MICOH|nr:60S ribosomal protein L26 [Microtus ochrogaster]
MKVRLSEDSTKASRLAKWSKCQKEICLHYFIFHIEQGQRGKANGTTVRVGSHPSKVVIITGLKLCRDRKKILERKAKSLQVVLAAPRGPLQPLGNCPYLGLTTLGTRCPLPPLGDLQLFCLSSHSGI